MEKPMVGVKKRGTPPPLKRGQSATAKKAVKGVEKETVKPTAKKAAPIKPLKLKAVPEKPVKEIAQPPVVKPIPAAKAPAAAKQIERAKAALKQEVTVAAATEAAPQPVKAKAKAKKISVDVNPNEAASALVQKWNTLFKKAEQIDSKPYNMRAVFEEKTAIVHKLLGWGYILANRNDRLEVLFKDGIKYLISNYKP
jgi:hypothetical protein